MLSKFYKQMNEVSCIGKETMIKYLESKYFYATEREIKYLFDRFDKD